MATVNQLPRRFFSDLGVPFNQHYSQLVDTVNVLAGYYGEVPLQSGVNLNGNKITNVGLAENNSDVLTLEAGNNNYSASVLRAALESNGSFPLQSVRRMNDTTQREQNSSWLKTILSTAPSANSTQVLFTNAGSMTTINIPASQFTYADGEVRPTHAAGMTVSNPSTWTIATTTGGGTLVTVATTVNFSGIAVGGWVTISGSSDPNFDGTWQVNSITSPDSFTWVDSYVGTATGGTVATAGVYYVYLDGTNPTPQFVGVASTADSPFGRLPVSNDQRQLIAVCTVGSSGGAAGGSAGGGTPNSMLNAGSFF